MLAERSIAKNTSRRSATSPIEARATSWALAQADRAASAEAADVVLLVDSLNRLLLGLEVARRSRRIAVESVIAGIGLSVAAMIAAAFGYLTPVEGALLQEVIDVAVILNALRALRIAPREASRIDLAQKRPLATAR